LGIFECCRHRATKRFLDRTAGLLLHSWHQVFVRVEALRVLRGGSVRRLIASEFVTLDGVMEAPGHEPHPDGRNAWALRHASEDQQRFKVDEVFQAGAILLGRMTYEIFAAFWPTAPKDEGFADRMNDIPKYVVSNALESRRGGTPRSSGATPSRRSPI
jgi:hypothetical protein